MLPGAVFVSVNCLWMNFQLDDSVATAVHCKHTQRFTYCMQIHICFCSNINECVVSFFRVLIFLCRTRIWYFTNSFNQCDFLFTQTCGTKNVSDTEYFLIKEYIILLEIVSNYDKLWFRCFEIRTANRRICCKQPAMQQSCTSNMRGTYR